MICLITDNNLTWYLEARPSSKFVSIGKNATITCYNISNSTVALSLDSQWYKIIPNGTLQKLTTNINKRIRSDVSQLRISFAESKDNGSYCCKGLMQDLNSCERSATANVIVITLPVISPQQPQTVYVSSNATVECIIEHVGNPPFVLHRWQKSGIRLVTDGTKYSSQLTGNRTVLTILNSTAEDEGYYECIIETLTFEIKQASVYLTVITHTGSCNGASYIVITML